VKTARSNRSPINIAERAFIAARSGHPPVHRRGWPDFWWVDEDGQFCAAEVKPVSRSSLRVAQCEILGHFYRQGVRTYTWNPDDGLLRFTPEGWVLCSDPYGRDLRYYRIDLGPEEGYAAVTEQNAELYEKALSGRTARVEKVSIDAEPDSLDKWSTARFRVYLHRLVLMVLERQQKLRRKHDDQDSTALEMRAIGWVLDRLGFPPATYRAVLDKCAPRRRGITGKMVRSSRQREAAIRAAREKQERDEKPF
jgi:hypothetical protein